MRRVLRLAAYRRLLLAYTLNELAWAVGSLALSYLVYRRTGSALGAAAFYLCAQFVPAVLSPAVVARVDRRAARRILPALYIGEAVSFAILAVLARHFSLAPVLVLTVFDGTLALTARPLARATTVRVTTEHGLLREGNALTNAAFSISFMAGPAIGGAVVAAGGASTALLVNVGLFVAVALVLATARLPEAPPDDGATPERGRLRAAAAYARRHRSVRTLLAVNAAGLLFFTLAVPVEVVYAQHTLHAGAGGYGSLLSAWGIGAVIGSLIYARWHGAPARALMAVGAALVGLGLGGMAAAPDLAAALVASAVGGLGNGVHAVSARTTLQEQTGESWMALVMSFSEALGEAMPGLGIVLGGALAVLGGARFALAIGGVGGLAVAVAIWMCLHPARGLVRAAAPPVPR